MLVGPWPSCPPDSIRAGPSSWKTETGPVSCVCRRSGLGPLALGCGGHQLSWPLAEGLMCTPPREAHVLLRAGLWGRRSQEEVPWAGCPFLPRDTAQAPLLLPEGSLTHTHAGGAARVGRWPGSCRSSRSQPLSPAVALTPPGQVSGQRLETCSELLPRDFCGLPEGGGFRGGPDGQRKGMEQEGPCM